ncbi:MAG: metallophosphoesterase [Balneolaceae bacterium]
MTIRRATLLPFFILLFISCSATEPWVSSNYSEAPTNSPPADTERAFSLFLIGDTGDPSLDEPDPVFELLKGAIRTEQAPSAVVFLGDNIYDDGFVPYPPEERERSERIMAANLDILEDPDVPGIFVPGNHDWWSNFEGMVEQERFIQNYPANRGHMHFSPQAGCPGPEVWELHPQLSVITLDSEWFISGHENYAGMADCPAVTRSEALAELQAIQQQNRDRILVLTTHHPFYSRAEHGGHYTWKQHIFPLTELHSAAWVPLPVVGSLYPLIRNMGVGNQDFSARANRNYRRDVLAQFQDHPLFISAAGHDHNLQYFQLDTMHQIVSGSGSKTGYVVKGGDAGFLLADYGFAILNLYENGELWLEFWTTQVPTGQNPVFRQPIDHLDSLQF